MITVRASDLRQHAYCARVPYYHVMMPGTGPPETYKMRVGREEEERVARLEARRKLRRFRLGEGRRRFRAYLYSRRLDVGGVCDLVIESPAGVFPVEFKMTSGGIARGHRLQLAAYAMALEEETGRAVETGFLYLLPAEDAVVVPLDAEVRDVAARAATELRAAVEAGDLPPSTRIRGRCRDCEFRNFCNDIF